MVEAIDGIITFGSDTHIGSQLETTVGCDCKGTGIWEYIIGKGEEYIYDNSR